MAPSPQLTLLKLHQRLYERSGGALGHMVLGVPSLLLRSVGRLSGEVRTNALIYARDGADYVVVASNGGGDRSPGWLHNVAARPEVDVQVGREHFAATARIVAQDEPGYQRLWTLVNEVNHGRYYHYQMATSRPIPLVVLTRVAAG